MKNGFLITLLVTGIYFNTFAQVAPENKVFDYAETKYELSLDIAPSIINGNYPSSLLFRKHYKTKKDKNAALRFGLNFSNGFRTEESDFTPINSTNFQSHFYAFTLGKEWQKIFTSKIIGYYGADLGFGYSSSRIIPRADDPALITTEKNEYFNYSAMGFMGMKYHFSRHFSVSAESGVSSRFNHSIFTEKRGISPEQNSVRQNFALDFVPLNAIRFAFHF